jgi:hypothetical protein
MRALAVVLLAIDLFAAAKGKLEPTKRTEKNGWIVVRLSGSPAEIGRQHGQLLAPEIADSYRVVKTILEHDSGQKWAFFREAAENVLWPRVPDEYRAELQGLLSGLQAAGMKIDLWDLVAYNAWLELTPYYVNYYNERYKVANAPKPRSAPEHCSAFVATGSYTKDGRPVIAHNAWIDYAVGSRWNVIFDITPTAGQHFIMDGLPGLIHSADDFGINASGLTITETTISQFSSDFDPNGIPEFVRARHALQYASTIDEFVAVMKEGNNGGYANTWLVADRKSGEIASLELGFKNVILQRTKDGYFAGSNFPGDAKLTSEETSFDPKDTTSSPLARRARWDQLMAENRGRIDVTLARRFLGDTFDIIEKKIQPSERTLCGRNDLSTRGMKPWQMEFGPAGAVQNKAADAAMMEQMSLWGAMGPQCGPNFSAAQHLKKNPSFAWQKPLLKDIPKQPWTLFQARPASSSAASPAVTP